MGIFQIPGNIKQEILPFALNPSAKINQSIDGGSTNLVGAPPQYFTYKTNAKDLKGGLGHLGMFPNVFNSLNFNDDLSYKMLYSRNASGKITTDQIKLTDILNSIPGVQIREYLPDTRLDQCLNFFISLFDKMKKIFGGGDSKTESAGSGSGDKKNTSTTEASKVGLFDKLIGTAKFAMEYFLGTVDPNLISNLDKRWKAESQFTSYKQEYTKGLTHGTYVLKFPYVLYYQLQSCVTTNIYEIPAIQQSKRILNSEGAPGWTGGSSSGMRLTSLLKTDGISVIGKMINGILGNVAIDYLPWWNAEAGSATKEPEITIEFDLFNDSAEAAMINFIFVNTIVPHNKWIQYHLFQHSSSLYDVKIEGINRLFACAGTFDVTYQGVLRDPPVAWLQDLVKKHANTQMNKELFLANLLNNKIIKIPDVYHVSLRFQSLLPANFNNFIFNYSANNVLKRETSKFGYYDNSEFSRGFFGAIEDFGTAVGNVWDNGGKYEGGSLFASKDEKTSK